jgi:hypothetical protein
MAKARKFGAVWVEGAGVKVLPLKLAVKWPAGSTGALGLGLALLARLVLTRGSPVSRNGQVTSTTLAVSGLIFQVMSSWVALVLVSLQAP